MKAIRVQTQRGWRWLAGLSSGKVVTTGYKAHAKRWEFPDVDLLMCQKYFPLLTFEIVEVNKR